MSSSPDLDQYHLFLKRTARADVAPDEQDTPGMVGSPSARRLLHMSVLGSGSGGNCSAFRLGQEILLIDAGLGPRTTLGRLEQINGRISQVRAICLTHLDADHYKPSWFKTLVRWRIAVYVYEGHLDRFYRQPRSHDLLNEGLVRVFTSKAFSPLADVHVHSSRVAHDGDGTCAFRMETPWGVVGYATDLGHVPDALITHFNEVDLLAIESNYDVQMQLVSGRPWYLKNRIMGGGGHLSNEQCLAAVKEIVARDRRGGPASVVLLHRSRECNCPDLLQNLYRQHQGLADKVILSDQIKPTPWIPIRKPA